ncbi:hypothetical protein JCM5353_001679 [Sporobolomyces roseus]
MGKSSKRTLEESAAAPASDAAGDVSMAAVDTPSKPKKSKKDKKSKDTAEGADGQDAEDDLSQVCEIAKPLAVKKTGKHVLKLVKKASKSRHLKRGVKEVVKSLRKGEKGIVVLAADISPLDILTHLPLLAEESACPYIWVTSKEGLGLASSTKRPTSCVMVAKVGAKKKAKKDGDKKEGKEDKEKDTEEEFQTSYEEVKKEVEALPAPLTVIDLDQEKHLTKETRYPYSGPVKSSKTDWQLLRSKWEDVAPQSEAHYSEWKPSDHTQHKKVGLLIVAPNELELAR